MSMPISPRERAHAGEQQKFFMPIAEIKREARARHTEQEGTCVECGDPAMCLCEICLGALVGRIIERLARTGQLERYMAEARDRVPPDEVDHSLRDAVSGEIRD